jgi:hypothetical protein
MDLLEALKRKQQESGASNAEFARTLHVSKVHWIATKMGRRPVGDSVRLGAVLAFEDLRELAERRDEAMAATA